MELLRRGRTNGEIAAELGITLDGAKFHVAEIISKLGADSREDAVERWEARRRVSWPALPGLAWVKWAGTAAGVVAVGAGVLVWAALLRGGSGSAEGPSEVSGAEPPAIVTSVPVAVPEPLPKVDGLVACPPPATAGGAPGIADWVDFVNFDGVHYMGGGFGNTNRAVERGRLGAPYGRVEVNVSETSVNGSTERQDCEAAFLPVGEILYRIDGYEPHFRIATNEGKVYEAYSMKGAATAGEFIDIGGKVRNINLSDDGSFNKDVSDPAVISQLVAELLASPIDTGRGGGGDAPVVRLRFDLADGSHFRATLFTEENRVWPDIMVPESFTAAIQAAVGR